MYAHYYFSLLSEGNFFGLLAIFAWVGSFMTIGRLTDDLRFKQAGGVGGTANQVSLTKRASRHCIETTKYVRVSAAYFTFGVSYAVAG